MSIILSSQQKVELDEKARGLPETINNRDAYKATKLPTCEKRPEEPELKFIIPETYSPLSIYQQIYNDLKDTKNNISLADDRIVARDPLVSFALDTDNFDIMRKTGEQLRLRGPVCLNNADHFDPTEVLWRGQATIKTLFSDAAGVGADRVEIEAAVPSKDIRFAYDHFIKRDNAHIDALYYDLTTEDLNVAAICVTTRASFNSVVYVPEYDAYVEFEQTCDPNFFLTPNGDIRAGKDMELEAEAKMVYVRPELNLTDNQLKEIYELAKQEYRGFITSNYPDFKEAKYSKVERALRAVGQYYSNNLKSDANVVTAFTETSQAQAELPYTAAINAGMMHAIKQKVSIFGVMDKINVIAERVKTMAQPQQLIPSNTNRSLCAADKRSELRLRA